MSSAHTPCTSAHTPHPPSPSEKRGVQCKDSYVAPNLNANPNLMLTANLNTDDNQSLHKPLLNKTLIKQDLD